MARRRSKRLQPKAAKPVESPKAKKHRLEMKRHASYCIAMKLVKAAGGTAHLPRCQAKTIIDGFKQVFPPSLVQKSDIYRARKKYHLQQPTHNDGA